MAVEEYPNRWYWDWHELPFIGVLQVTPCTRKEWQHYQTCTTLGLAELQVKIVEYANSGQVMLRCDRVPADLRLSLMAIGAWRYRWRDGLQPPHHRSIPCFVRTASDISRKARVPYRPPILR